MEPQVVCGGGTLRPRKARPPSAMMATPTTTRANAATGRTALGSTSRRRTRHVVAPMPRAAVTKSRCTQLMVALRATRANAGTATMATATVTLRRLWPRNAVTAMTSTSAGKASITSTMPMSTVSVLPRWYPASRPMAPPTTRPTATATSPTVSDTRAPYTSRDRMSRPISSVPSRCPPVPGTAAMWAKSLRVGLFSGRTAANAAPNATRAIHAAGAQNDSPSARRRPAVGREASGAGAPDAGATVARSGMAHPRVEHAVEDVDEEVGQHVGDGDHEHEPLHDDVLAAADGVDQPRPHARQCEQVLHDHGAADQRAGVDAEHGEERERRGPQCVAQQDAACRQALGARHEDVLLLQRGDEVGPQQPGVHRAQGEREGDGRERDRPQVPRHRVSEVRVAGGGQPVRPHGEHEHEHDGDDEVGHREGAERCGGDG